jgi:hypothetical protein
LKNKIMPAAAIQHESQSSHGVQVVLPRLITHYEVHTDFGLMKFSSDDSLGYWWEKLMRGETQWAA